VNQAESTGLDDDKDGLSEAIERAVEDVRDAEHRLTAQAEVIEELKAKAAELDAILTYDQVHPNANCDVEVITLSGERGLYLGVIERGSSDRLVMTAKGARRLIAQLLGELATNTFVEGK
jgi:hypothetical protein